MKRQTLLVMLLALILVFTVFSPALAKKPSIERYEFPNSFPIDCDDFTALFEEDVKLTIKTFYDKNGVATHQKEHWNIIGTVTNSETGTVLRNHAAFNITFDLPDDGSRSESGIYWHLSMPGKGVVVIYAGRLISEPGGEITIENGVMKPDTEDFICDGLRGL